MPDEDQIRLRRAEPGDRSAVVELCRVTHDWDPAAPNAEFFAWKHDDNPFGPSPMWVAVEGERIVGVRVFLCWRFRDPRGATVRAVRAVDAGTDESVRRRGVFTRLTLRALQEFADDGVAFVFNTPNDQSGPGNVKMGWADVGRTPLAVRPRSPVSLARMLRSRTAAEKWSQPTDVGEDPLDVFVEGAADLLPPPSVGGWSTERSTAYYRWRYSFEPLHYRVFMAGDSAEDGAAVFRLHRRGDAMEATVVDTVGEAIPAAAWRRLLRETGADYLIRVPTSDRRVVDGFIRLAGAGPMLTQRQLDESRLGTTDDFDLSLGDVELF